MYSDIIVRRVAQKEREEYHDNDDETQSHPQCITIVPVAAIVAIMSRWYNVRACVCVCVCVCVLTFLDDT